MSTAGGTAPKVAAFNTTSSTEEKQKASCKFWGSAQGCRRGDQCTYGHSWEGINKQNRCFVCSGEGHMSRECPTRRERDQRDSKKVAKVKNPMPTKESPVSDLEAPDKPKEENATTTSSQQSSGSLKSTQVSRSREGEKVAGGGEASTGSAESATALIAEATSLLKSLRALKACRLRQICRIQPDAEREGEVALLDGGATHPLRMAEVGEKNHLIPVQVELAHGSTTLFRKEGCSTLLSLDEVEPIIPLSLLVQHGFRIDWSANGCTINHPRQGPILCWLRGGCPVMKRTAALAMLKEFEELERGHYSITAEDAQWWEENIPGVPGELLEFMKGQSWCPAGDDLPWNRRQRRMHQTSKGIIVHLFSGTNVKRWKDSLPSGYTWLFVDPLLGSRYDLHSPQVWGYLCWLAKQGRIKAVLGGPPCRTVSRLRNRGPPGPRKVRARGDLRWGLDDLTPKEAQMVANDTTLVLKQVALWKLAKQGQQMGRLTGFLLESPRDPASYLESEEDRQNPSYFEWPQLQQLLEEDETMRMINFDQGATGHPRRKPTGVLSNLPMLEQLELCQGGGNTNPVGGDLSQRMAEWSPGFVKAIQLALRSMLEEDENCKVARLDMDQWRRHVRMQHTPFRRDCRTCLEAMGTQNPHRRSRTASSAYTLAVDIIGPFPVGKDPATGRMAKYALLGTVPLPVPDHLPGEPAEEEDLTEEQVRDVPSLDQEDLEEEDLERDGRQDPPELEDQQFVEEGEEQVIGREEIDELRRPHQLQNITMVEVMEDRGVDSLLGGLSRLYARFRCLGINVMRLHSDREKGMLSRRVSKWCGHRHLVQTFTQGDDPQANGRAEAEVQQVKRRMRLIIHQAQVEPELWPGAIRHAAEERCRQQLSRLGVPAQPMLRFGSKVAVRTKRWHKAGQLVNPFISMQLVGPSPLMTSGWVVRHQGRVQHVRTALQPSPEADQAALELQEIDADIIRRRVTGKQSLDPHPLQDVISHMYEEVQPAQQPALSALSNFRTGGGTDPDPGACLQVEDNGSCGESAEGMVKCLECDLWQLGEHRGAGCRFCEGDLPKEQDGLQVPGEEALDLQACSWTQAVQWHEEEVRSHWQLKRMWLDQLNQVAVGAQQGSEHGGWLQVLEEQLMVREERLQRQHGALESWRMAALQAAGGSGEGEEQKPSLVLQTYTVSLAQVRRELHKWVEPFKDEYVSLSTSTGAIFPTTEEALKKDPRYPWREEAPAMLVPTVKSPHGRHRARVVICGNHLTKSQVETKAVNPLEASSTSSPFELYAGGADATVLRALLRKSALEKWSVASLDVKTAFLLAPRRDAQQRLLITRPPRVLVEAKVCAADEIWEVRNSLYGLQEAPLNWARFRDEEMAKFRWTDEGECWKLARTQEPNLWKVILDDPSKSRLPDKVYGFVAVYVDDILVTGDERVTRSTIARFQQQWKCSTPEWLTPESSLRFCGFEIAQEKRGLRLHQESYLRDLLARYPDVKSAQSPLPGVLDETEEMNPEVAEVRKSQTLVGELLWLAVRSRPDISFAVSWMGRQVTHCPCRVQRYGAQVLGFLQSTMGLGLLYEASPDEPQWEESKGIHMYSDASFGPPGSRGHQGLIAMYSGAPIQWESKQQPFGTLSSSESELMGYSDALTMGESCASIVAILESGDVNEVMDCVLHGDSQSGIRILQSPDGPWRTRHLRLRSFVLRERIRTGCWQARHEPGASLSVDLLTKSIVSPPSWRRFREFTGLCAGATQVKEAEDCVQVKRLIGLLSGLIGISCWQPVSAVAKVAKSVTIAAVASSVAWLMGRKGGDDPKKEGEPAFARTGASKEGNVERRKCQEETRENEPVSKPGRDFSPKGSPGGASACEPWIRQPPRVSALRAPITHVGLGTDLPWELMRFSTPPTGTDRWECLGVGLGGGEWWVRVLKKSRVRTFHPLHRGTPMSIARLSATRVTVAFSRGNPREVWKRVVITDDWIENRGSDVEGLHEWCGYTFFYVKFEALPEGRAGNLDRRDVRPGPLPPPGSVAAGGGYGGSIPGRSRAVQRGRKALQGSETIEDEEVTYGGGGISACDIESIEGGTKTGYELRLQGRERRGESGDDPGQGVNMGSQAVSSGDQLPPEADQWPIWLGIETAVLPQQNGGLQDEDGESDGSFEFLHTIR